MADRAQGHVVIVHLECNDDAEVCVNLTEAMQNFFALTCSMAGPSRLPPTGIILLKQQGSEVVLPLKDIGNNFASIQFALGRMNDVAVQFCAEDFGAEIHDETILAGLKSAVNVFKRHWPPLLEFEITLFTSNCSPNFARHVDRAVGDLRPPNLKVKTDLIWPDEGMAFDESVQSVDFYEPTGLVDVTNSDSHPLALLNFMMGWLQGKSTDCEGLHLMFPDLIIKCDIVDPLLDVSCIPYQENYMLQSATGDRLIPHSASVQKNARPSRPVRLQVIGQVPSEAVCDSVVFGHSSILRGTSCWKIDWDELELNQELFHGLCFQLYEQSIVLIARLVSDGPRGHFVVMPCPQSSLAIKPIAVNELMLPVDQPALQKPSDNILQIVSTAMSSVERLESYNPLEFHSGLFDCLKRQLMKSTSELGRVQKAVIAAMEQQHSVMADDENKPSTSRMGKTQQRQRQHRGDAEKKRKPMTAREIYVESSCDFPTEL